MVLEPYMVVLLLLAGSAAITDAKSGLIPNRLTLPPLVLGPLAHGSHGGVAALIGSLLAAAACAAVPLFLFSRGAMGGGDLKLFAAIGALVGLQQGLLLQLLSYLFAASAALVWLALRGELVAVLVRSIRLLVPRSRAVGAAPGGAAREVRLGPAVFAASLALGARAWFGG